MYIIHRLSISVFLNVRAKDPILTFLRGKCLNYYFLNCFAKPLKRKLLSKYVPDISKIHYALKS